MIRRFTDTVGLNRRRSVDVESVLLDTEEQKEIIENLRIDNDRSNSFHREALRASGILLGCIKLLCAIVQFLFPWALPMHATVQAYYPRFVVVFLEFYAACGIIYFSLYIKSQTMQRRHNLTLSLIAVFVFDFVASTLFWYPTVVVPLWFIGAAILFALVVLYADITLKNTSKDIDKLNGMMYSFKKL